MPDILMPDTPCLLPRLHPAPLQKNKRKTKTTVSHCGGMQENKNNNQLPLQVIRKPDIPWLICTPHLGRKTKQKQKQQLATAVAQK